MSEPYLGQIKIVGFNFAPRGWAKCDGQILPINVNQSLYSLLGTVYGGDGVTTFALPDMRGRAPVHVGYGFNTASFSQGERGGQEGHTLSTAELPQHTHNAQVKAGHYAVTVDNPEDHYLGSPANPVKMFANEHQTTMSPSAATVHPVGSNQAHHNMQPYQVLNYIIALQGLYPPRD
jgi:microcystin-dependent protein